MKPPQDYTGKGSIGNDVAIGMIVSTSVLAAISSIWHRPGLFASASLNEIGAACVSYFNNHKKAPGKLIVRIMRHRAEHRHWDEDTSNQISELLRSHSNKWKQRQEEINPDWLLEVARKHFSQAVGIRFAEAYRRELERGHEDKADELFRNYRKPEIGGDVGTFAEDPLAFGAAFESKKDALITYSDGLHEFFGDQLCRGVMLSFVAREKRGKSIWLLDLAFRAQICRKKVALIVTGDMTQNQVFLRIASRAARRPFRRGKIMVPRTLSQQNGEGIIGKYTEKQFDQPMDCVEAHEAYKKFLADKCKSEGELFWVCSRPNLSVEEIRRLLELKERRDGFRPDVVILDYADPILPPKGIRDRRDQYDAIWRELRAWNMEAHNLIVTATQCNRAGYSVRTLRMEHISEDKRKLGHAHGIVGINQTEEEKQRGIVRLNWMALRDEDYNDLRCVYCAGCPGMYNPTILSIYPEYKDQMKVRKEDEDD